MGEKQYPTLRTHTLTQLVPVGEDVLSGIKRIDASLKAGRLSEAVGHLASLEAQASLLLKKCGQARAIFDAVQAGEKAKGEFLQSSTERKDIVTKTLKGLKFSELADILDSIENKVSKDGAKLLSVEEQGVYILAEFVEPGAGGKPIGSFIKFTPDQFGF